MNHFEAKGGALCCEAVPLERIARDVGTPTYVYSTATLTRHLRVVQEAFAAVPTLVCYSVKANSNLAVLKLFAKGGAGFDIVSGGELERVRRVGGDTRKVVFAGVGKTEAEMVAALKAGILMFNVESAEELEALSRVGRQLGVAAPFALRVNPDVDAKTHRYIATGLKTSKFGVPFDEAMALYARSRKLEGLVARGLDCHIGSQLTDTRPVREAMTRVGGLYRQLKAKGFPLTHLDVGGGLGVTYTTESPPGVADYARAVIEPLKDLGATLVLEPGRVLVANAGVLLTRVLYRKQTPAKHFVIVDAGMNDLLRPALYEAHHDIRAVAPRKGRARTVEVVGPVCESSDVLGHARRLPPVAQGDLLAIMTAGAYGMSMSSSYNSRPRPAEVLVDEDRARVVRTRETFTDLMRGETA
ncbi:MAG: diaminopimelate decarboxylase [Myxococcaceae bacterium]|jgi:diaminopimelate decarboxylase|nr:diaminopimelate decarboxylase [Myxococcaceae bacterium]MCA3015152.1 diaminopimelate decarboxylase [Myxococcaceae bacterium]